MGALEVRRFFDTFAIAPSAEYDFDESEWTLQLPIFLVRNDKKAFTGGLRLGWTSEEEDLAAAIFVTKPLNP